jgi:hypothetical protein
MKLIEYAGMLVLSLVLALALIKTLGNHTGEIFRQTTQLVENVAERK